MVRAPHMSDEVDLHSNNYDSFYIEVTAGFINPPYQATESADGFATVEFGTTMAILSVLSVELFFSNLTATSKSFGIKVTLTL